MTKAYYDNYWRDPEMPRDPLSIIRLSDTRLRLFIQSSNGAVRVLDAGCGNGSCSARLAEAGFQVWGVDISERAIASAKERYPQAIFCCASLEEQLPFQDGAFDAVYAGDVIEHIYDTRRMIAELGRVLKPGGMLFVSTPYHGLLKNLSIALLNFEKHFDPTGAHIRFFTKRSLTRLLLEGGFKIERFLYLGRFWPLWKNMVAIARKP